MMGKGRCWTRRPALNNQSRRLSYVERDNFNDDNKCESVGLGGVSIVQEFLNIWDDLKKHYDDNYGEVATETYKLKAVHAVKNEKAWKAKEVVKPDIVKASKKRSVMRLKRVSRKSYLANKKLVKISTDNSERRNKAYEEESGAKSVSPEQKTMLLPDLNNKAASGDHLEDTDEVDEKVLGTDMSGDCLSFKDLVDVLDTGVPLTTLVTDDSKQVGRLGKARARPQPTLSTKKKRRKKSKPLPSVPQPILGSITEEDSAIVSVQGSSWVGLGTLFREAFREYETQSGDIGDSVGEALFKVDSHDDAVIKDENHNEPESMDDCHNAKKAIQKFDDCVEATPCGDNDEAAPKVVSNEEKILTEDVPKEVVTKEVDKHAAFLASDSQDEAVAKRNVDDGDVTISGGHDMTLVECDGHDEAVLSVDCQDQSVVIEGVDVVSWPSGEDVGDDSTLELLGDGEAVTIGGVPTGSPISQVVSPCDLNNNCLKFSPMLATIIDVDEDDNSEEDDLASPAVTNVVIKHPLEHSWTFWYFYPDRNRTWEENLRTIQTVSTIEDFWAVQNWIEPPSSLQPGADYSLFKTGISPDWEDVANRKGGRWVVNTSRHEVDRDWVEVIMGMVGQQFGEEQDMQVNGAVVSSRNRGDKVAVWVREVVESDKVGTTVNMMLGRTGVFKIHKKHIGK